MQVERDGIGVVGTHQGVQVVTALRHVYTLVAGVRRGACA